ncbi:GIY-YIG nuclease family protein [Syntrophotalea acetylenica]|uniref:GIY-YIG nuclease family protein n=1 Tax=Syntrophotalea acetylenica TaxID=29542 RepID=UPI002A35ABC0|nr:GIY-YIG nuclease family protein [Syntrophotalea acetylenica]MDY0263513.1 GIY-YIG nuclease family protein [Syntrophotalea acetylenica]
MPTATIKLFLVHGDPKRLRTAELSNWSGKAVAGPRSEFDGILAREESQQSGVYLLAGTDPETGKPAIYIGEAECIKDRIKAHLSKDFWNQIAYFVSKDENLTKSHIRYVEGRLIEQTIKAKRCIITNGQGSGSKLPESDREDMEVFLTKVYQLLPVLGIELLMAVSEKDVLGGKKHELLHCDIKNVKAQGYPVPNGFLVLKGSEAVHRERPSVEKWPWPKNMRQKFLEDGVLINRGDKLEFSEDVEFSSPSAAAAVIQGGHANGLTAWKSSNGFTLKDMESV